MIYQFTADGSRLYLASVNEGVTGNVNSYGCQVRYVSDDWTGRECFAVFKVGADIYTQVLTAGYCLIPAKALEKAQTIYVGIYGIKPGDDTDRLSTEWVVLNIAEGAYNDGTAPVPPEPDVWEQYIEQIKEVRDTIAPYIGENKNWYFWDDDLGTYVDSEQKAVPEKGVDYYTQADIEALGLDNKVDKVEGKGLSSNDYTDADQEKVSHLPENTYDALYEKADKTALAEKADKTELIGKAGTWEGAEIFNDYENNAASMDYAHAEGQSTTASGSCSHAEGFDTHAAAPYSHAEGAHTKAGGYGFGAHAEGLGTYALSSSAGSMRPQHVEGAYNIKDITIEETGENTYLHIAGNGTSDTNRSNAHTLDWSGNAWFAGKVTVGSDAEELATKSDLDAKLGGVYRFKGSIDELPTSSMQIGDVYNMQLDGSATINENFEGLTGTFTVTNTDGYGGTIVFNINDSSFIPTYDFTISLLYNGDLNVDFEVHSENGIYYFHSSMTQIIGIDVGESETFSFSDVTDIKYTIDWGNGDNIAWDGRFWDKLSATVDLSGYYDKTDINGFVDELTETKADKQTEDGGFMAGEGAHSVQDGGAIGLNTATKSGGAVGREAYAVDGGAVGNNTWADLGGAVGNNAVANYGGAIGNGAVAGDGFSGGSEAKVSIGEDGFDIDAIQLGTGTNSVPKTLQVYSHTVMNADGSLPYVHTARPYVEETLPAAGAALALNTIYDLGTQTSVTLKLPSANVGNFIQVDFLCGDTPAAFTIDAASSAIVSDYDFTPEPDKAYSLFFDYGRLAGSLYGWRFSYAEYTYTEV